MHLFCELNIWLQFLKKKNSKHLFSLHFLSCFFWPGIDWQSLDLFTDTFHIHHQGQSVRPDCVGAQSHLFNINQTHTGRTEYKVENVEGNWEKFHFNRVIRPSSGCQTEQVISTSYRLILRTCEFIATERKPMN